MISHRVVMRPRSLLESGDLALVFVRSHWRFFLPLLPWVLAPAIFAGLLSLLGVVESEFAWLLCVVGTGVGSGVFVPLCGELLLVEKTDIKGVKRRFRSLFWRWTFVRLWTWTLTLLSFGFAYPWMVFVPEALLLEGGKMKEAMMRSGALSGATPGRAMMIGASVLGLLALATLGTSAGLEAIHSLFGFGGGVPEIAMFVGFSLATPYVCALRFLLYIDCRTRREGWDLQVQMKALVLSEEARLTGSNGEAA